jgi:hypothetical protein
MIIQKNQDFYFGKILSKKSWKKVQQEWRAGWGVGVSKKMLPARQVLIMHNLYI